MFSAHVGIVFLVSTKEADAAEVQAPVFVRQVAAL